MTLLRLILGLLKPQSGRVRLCDDPVTALERREITRRAALLMQDSPLELPLTVREVVALGRLPYLRRFEIERAADRAAIDPAMEIFRVRARVDVDPDGLLRVMPIEPLDGEAGR